MPAFIGIDCHNRFWTLKNAKWAFGKQRFFILPKMIIRNVFANTYKFSALAQIGPDLFMPRENRFCAKKHDKIHVLVISV